MIVKIPRIFWLDKSNVSLFNCVKWDLQWLEYKVISCRYVSVGRVLMTFYFHLREGAEPSAIGSHNIDISNDCRCDQIKINQRATLYLKNIFHRVSRT